MQFDLHLTGRRHVPKVVAKDKPTPLQAMLALDLCDLELSVRAHGCLSSIGVMNVGGLAGTTRRKLLSCRNLGPSTISEIEDTLAKLGLTLGSPPCVLEGK